MMSTFVALTLAETNLTEDRSRFEMTFIDAEGEKHLLSIPSSVAADLVPVLDSLAANQRRMDGADFTRLPKQYAIGCAVGERLVLVQFDGEAPYALGVEVAEELGRDLQEQSERVALFKRSSLH
jgi:hypothetical protein